MNAGAVIVLLAIALALVAMAVALWPADGSSLFGPPAAQPGTWFLTYHTDWTHAHPGAFMNGTAKSGSFYLGRGDWEGHDVWGSSTLEWDREWFRANKMGMPRYTTYVEPPGPAKPNQFRIGTLGPGESVSIPIVIKEVEQ